MVRAKDATLRASYAASADRQLTDALTTISGADRRVLFTWLRAAGYSRASAAGCADVMVAGARAALYQEMAAPLPRLDPERGTEF